MIFPIDDKMKCFQNYYVTFRDTRYSQLAAGVGQLPKRGLLRKGQAKKSHGICPSKVGIFWVMTFAGGAENRFTGYQNL